MKRLKVAALVLASGSLLSFSEAAEKLCHGFLPENNMRIPISALQNGGLTEKEFNGVLDELQKFYSPLIQAKGGNLQINRNWTDDTVNASAIQFGSTWVINMYGGLARHPKVNRDGFQLVACHETGHHLGGAPKLSGWSGSWASNEGASDYFATTRCLRFMFSDSRANADFVANNTIDPFLKQTCEQNWNTQDEENQCIRMAMAGMNVTELFKDLMKESDAFNYNTPDPAKVSTIDNSHPGTQCRLDTYYQGALCTANKNTELSDSDYHVGTCTALTHSTGLRPQCWFKPDEANVLSLGPQASN